MDPNKLFQPSQDGKSIFGGISGSPLFANNKGTDQQAQPKPGVLGSGFSLFGQQQQSTDSAAGGTPKSIFGGQPGGSLFGGPKPEGPSLFGQKPN